MHFRVRTFGSVHNVLRTLIKNRVIVCLHPNANNFACHRFLPRHPYTGRGPPSGKNHLPNGQAAGNRKPLVASKLGKRTQPSSKVQTTDLRGAGKFGQHPYRRAQKKTGETLTTFVCGWHCLAAPGPNFEGGLLWARPNALQAPIEPSRCRDRAERGPLFAFYRNPSTTSGGAAAKANGSIEHPARPWLKLRMALE